MTVSGSDMNVGMLDGCSMKNKHRAVFLVVILNATPTIASHNQCLLSCTQQAKAKWAHVCMGNMANCQQRAILRGKHCY